MTEEQLESSGPSQEFKQVLALILLTGAVVILGAVYVIQRELRLQREAKLWALDEFGLRSPTKNRLDARFQDANRDLVADFPTDPQEWLVPEHLVFSFIAGDEQVDPEVWQPLLERIAEATGIQVVQRQFETVEEQLMALHQNSLHITVLNTGSIPIAVNTCGFVPLCTKGEPDGSFGVKTKFIVPRQSPAKKISDLRKQRITFTSFSSNSGFKAPIVVLQEDFDMRPGLDYEYGFSNSHDSSIAMIAANEIAAAPVASDILTRAIEKGVIHRNDFRVIYSSARFPPGAIGVSHRLNPDTVEKMRSVLLDFQLSESPLGQALNADQFVSVTYKDDWALIRRIDNALGIKHDLEGILADAQSAEESIEELPVDASGKSDEAHEPNDGTSDNDGEDNDGEAQNGEAQNGEAQNGDPSIEGASSDNWGDDPVESAEDEGSGTLAGGAAPIAGTTITDETRDTGDET